MEIIIDICIHVSTYVIHHIFYVSKHQLDHIIVEIGQIIIN